MIDVTTAFLPPHSSDPRLTKALRVRGTVCVAEGIIQANQLTSDGRLELPEDDTSWHIVAMRGGAALGAARLRWFTSLQYAELCVSHSAIAEQARLPVSALIKLAKAEHISFAEAGYWVIAPDVQGHMVALMIARAAFRLAAELGGCRGITTATTRPPSRCRRSAGLLKRLGGEVLIGPYYDPAYGCSMELLQFNCCSIPAAFVAA